MKAAKNTLRNSYVILRPTFMKQAINSSLRNKLFLHAFGKVFNNILSYAHAQCTYTFYSQYQYENKKGSH